MSMSIETEKIIQIAVCDGKMTILTNRGRIFYRDSESWVEEPVPDFGQSMSNGHYFIDDIKKTIKKDTIEPWGS